jgi:S1-C subfamily serine protease
MPRLAGQAQTSVAVRSLTAVLPPPTEIVVGLGRLLDASGLPEVFIGLEPVPAPPVDPPADPEVRRIAGAAQRSTAKVQAGSCGAIATGSGFVIEAGYVITNAHVVAGGRGVRVTADGEVWDAVPVLFDPELDIAVLWVEGLDAPALTFADEDPRRGTTGAALGFPGGGAFTVIPSAVTGRYDAQGRDIYGDERVVRPILELRAEVERGSSGGPLVLADGTVGGVIFAESRSDEGVGYALAASRVAETIAASIGETNEVATGDCLR